MALLERNPASAGRQKRFPPIRRAGGDLGVGVPGGDQAQQFPLPAGDLRCATAAALGIKIGLAHVGTQPGEQRPVASS
jgi:hypothetical protein